VSARSSRHQLDLGLKNPNSALKPDARAYFVGFAWCAAITVLIHCPMLFKPHSEGDEFVYYVLSQRMGWDLSNYTTKDDPRVNELPYTIYRGPVFHHPPLLPLVLKAGSQFTMNPLLSLPGVATPRAKAAPQSLIVPGPCIAAAFLFEVFVCVAALWYMWRFAALVGIEPQWGVAALIGLAVCPLVLFSTVRIHHDGLMGLMLVCGLIAFAEALDRGRVICAVEAALWLVAAFNVRFNAIAALPIILMMPFYQSAIYHGATGGQPGMGRGALAPPRTRSARLARPRWIIVAIVFVAVLTAGLQHYFRLFAAYGTLWPTTMIQPLPGVTKFSPLLALVERMSRSWVLWELAAMFPLAVLFVAPWNFRQYAEDLRCRRWPAFFVGAFGFLFAVQLFFAYKPVRYFAAVTPLMHLCWPYLLKIKPPQQWLAWSTWAVAGLTLLLMVTTGFLNATLHDPDQAAVVPSLVFYWPPFARAYQAH
jgi:hypothetical protein